MKLSTIRKLRDLRTIRAWLGLSLREMSLLIPPTGDRRQSHISRALVCAWQNGTREPDQSQLDVIARLIANKLTDLTNRTIGVKVTHNSPWRVRVYAYCADCRHLFELPTMRARRCARCVVKAKGGR